MLAVPNYNTPNKEIQSTFWIDKNGPVYTMH